MRFSFLFVLLSFSWHGVSQRIELKSFDPIIGFNDSNGELSIIDDTNQVVTYNSFGKCIQKERIVKKAINFNELKEEFLPVFLHNQLHFVERGCGRVFKFNKGSIERIDRSFSHRNQFDALVVEIRDTLFCIGGYGFFTVKDHVTYFDEGMGQWFLKNNSFLMNHQILKPLYYLGKDGITIYGGDTYVNGIVRDDFSKRQEKLLKFSLNSKKWEEVGDLNSECIKYLKKVSFTGKNTLVTLNQLMIFFPDKNEVHVLQQENNVRRLFFFNHQLIENKVIRHAFNQFTNSLIFYDYDEFRKSKNAKILPFYQPKISGTDKHFSKFVLSMAVLFLILLFWIYLKRKWKRAEPSEIPQEVLWLLAVWVEKENLALELVDLNALVSYDNPELETLKKRRESLLKRLKQFLVEHEKFTEDEVYSTELNPRDKRIKRFKLHPKVVKWYNRVK